MTDTLVILAGLGVGSFFNVVIHRLPRGESLWGPRSCCPACGQSIPWFDNIPVLSFFLLRGRCRQCLRRISFRYPLVELASAFLWWGSWSGNSGTGAFLIQGIFLSLLMVAGVTDLETGVIPDGVTYLGLGAGLGTGFLLASGEGFWGSLLGLGVGGGLTYLTGLAGNWVFQRDSMGGGDVKLMAVVGSFLGWQKAALCFFTAPFFALPFALYLRWARKEEIIPYGPFLSLAAAIQFFWGENLWSYFLRM